MRRRGDGADILDEMKPSNIEWHAFGDESAFRSVVTYAVVGVKPELQYASQLALESIKKQFGGRPGARLHCREMFTPAAHRRSDWAHLSIENIKELILSFAQKMDELNIRRNVGIVHKKVAPTYLQGVGSVETPLKLGDKQMCTIAFVGVFGAIMEQVKTRSIKLWVDKDQTKIDWWGKNRQASLTRELTNLDFGFKTKPEVSICPSPVMLEAADLLAYTVGRVIESEQKDDFFNQVKGVLAPAESVMRWAVQ